MSSPVGAVETPARRICGAIALGCNGTHSKSARPRLVRGRRTKQYPRPPPPALSDPRGKLPCAFDTHSMQMLARVAPGRTVRRPWDVRVSLATHSSTPGRIVYELGAAQRVQLTQLPPLQAAELLALEDAARVVHPANRSLIALGLKRRVPSGHAGGHQRRHRTLWNGDHARNCPSGVRGRRVARGAWWRRLGLPPTGPPSISSSGGGDNATTSKSIYRSSLSREM
jgi:hypothetical protein